MLLPLRNLAYFICIFSSKTLLILLVVNDFLIALVGLVIFIRIFDYCIFPTIVVIKISLVVSLQFARLSKKKKQKQDEQCLQNVQVKTGFRLDYVAVISVSVLQSTS